MMLWVIFALLALLTAGLLVTPLLRRARDPLSRAVFDLQIYREQLAELERDRERGVLPADQAEAARTEIHRRILALDETESAAPSLRRLHLPLALLLGLGLPLTAGLIYTRLGAPELPGKPFASRQSDPAFQMAALTGQLAARLAAAPDGEGFRRLGEAYMTLQRFPDAVQAFQRADQLGVKDSTMLSGWGEAVAMSEGGMVVPPARKLFQRALSADSDNPQARFYLGLAEAQIGDFRKAVAIWRDLEAASGTDAPWLEALRQHIAEAAKQGGFDAGSVAATPPQASAGDSQAATIRSMVDGLAARLQQQPDDFDGWMRLSLSYKVLGEAEKGKDAARHAIKLRPRAVEPRLALAQIQLGVAKEDALPTDFLATLREVLAIDGNNTTALYYLGAGEASAGHADEARKLWGKLLQQMPPDMPERGEIQKRLDALPR